MLQIKNKSIFFFYKFNVFYKDQNLILIVIYHNSNDNFKSHISFREHKEGDIYHYSSNPLHYISNEMKKSRFTIEIFLKGFRVKKYE
jgi:hypothetical protein